MPTYLAPGIYVEETSSGTKPITGVSTSVAAFVGVTEKGPVGQATLVNSFGDFVKRFGGPIRVIENVQEYYLYYSIRHFFAHGGTRCYIVRVVGAGAVPATATLGDLTVNAISPGDWGESLNITVNPTSQFSLLLEADVAGGATEIQLPQNNDVRVGSLLWIVNEATGIVSSVAANAVTFTGGIVNRNDGTASDFAIPDGTIAFSPDLNLLATVNGAVAVTGGSAATVTLNSAVNSEGQALRVGDVVNFAIAQEAHPALSIAEALINNQTVMQVGISATAAAFPSITSRVYERGFALSVRQGNDIVETHENLSLIAADRINQVAVRLPTEAGRSFFVTASGDSTSTVGHGQGNLTNGNNGLPPTATGTNLGLIDTMHIGDPAEGTGLSALDNSTDASMLCIPHATSAVAAAAITYCEGRRDMIYIIDPPRASNTVSGVTDYVNNDISASTYAAIYFPWIQIVDPSSGRRLSVPPSGSIAGIFARSDAKRGVHKAPAGIDVGRVDVAVSTATILTKADNDTLHGNRVNAIRNLPEGIVVWGARTISADPEWNYVNVRRLFLFLEQSIEGGTQWVAFEPNDESLWKKIRRNISAFLRIQWNEGKLVGDTEEQAFFVKCDAETNPPEIVDAGIVITEIGVAPSKPAEFVVFRIKQIAGGDA